MGLQLPACHGASLLRMRCRPLPRPRPRGALSQVLDGRRSLGAHAGLAARGAGGFEEGGALWRPLRVWRGRHGGGWLGVWRGRHGGGWLGVWRGRGAAVCGKGVGGRGVAGPGWLASGMAGAGFLRAGEGAMARPTIIPTSVRATAPEAFMVLHLRMRVVEEQTNTLVRDLEALGVDRQSLDHFHSKTSETPASHPAISPVQARVAFVGENTLWRNCETLVNRMCRLESVVQTLKLNIFRLQTEKEMNPKHAAQLEQRLNAIHEEHLQEMKIVQQEAMKLRQHLSDMKEAEEKAKEEVQRLSTALEITTASKVQKFMVFL
uniref:Coiled-coil domain containing 150 n=2 Tax=Calidris pygmaea TaxID=425635 RepID=A0A8C3JZ77_9CHAR